MTWLHFIASTLACFRLTRLITDDKITDWFRRLVKREAPRKIKKKVAEGIECPFCVSAWVCAYLVVLLIVYLHVITPPEALLYHPAIWGGSVIWNQIFVKLSKGKK